MDAKREDAMGTGDARTQVERISEVEMVVTRTFAAPVPIVFRAWTEPQLFMRWWAPKSMGVPLRSCEMDVRTGGKYRLEFGHESGEGHPFFGKYLEVVPNARIVWTNDEGDEGAVTTVTFEDRQGGTLVVLREVYPSKEALDEAFIGMESCMPEQYAQLDAVLVEGVAQ